MGTQKDTLTKEPNTSLPGSQSPTDAAVGPEQSSSNELAQRLRDWNDKRYDSGNAYAVVDEAADKIDRLQEQVCTLESTYSYECSQVERLTRERDEARKFMHINADAVDALQMERDRLTRENAQNFYERNDEIEKNARLRAALGWIEDVTRNDDMTHEIHDKAREALRGVGAITPAVGAADETSARLCQHEYNGPGPCGKPRCIKMLGHDGEHEYL